MAPWVKDLCGWGCFGGEGSIPSPEEWVKGSGITEAAAGVEAAAQVWSLTQELYMPQTAPPQKKIHLSLSSGFQPLCFKDRKI